MDRREFLKLLGTFTVVGFVNIKQAGKLLYQPTAAFGHTVYRAGQNGQVLQSKDGEVTWQVNTSFGKDCSVQDIYVRDNVLYARLVYRSHTILLKSYDGKIWYTSNWVSPSLSI